VRRAGNADSLSAESGKLQDLHIQAFVRFSDDMIDHRFHITRALPDSKLSISAGAFAHDLLNVRNLSAVSQLGPALTARCDRADQNTLADLIS
jgi:hypothetical protein